MDTPKNRRQKKWCEGEYIANIGTNIRNML